MLRYGKQWDLLQDYFAFEETVNSAGWTPGPNQVWVYAKDKAGVSALYLEDDAGTVREIAPTSAVTGSGTADRLAYWDTSSTLAAHAAFSAGRVPFGLASGLLSDSANLAWDDTNGILTAKNKASGATIIVDSSNAAHNSALYLKVNASALYRIQIEAATSKLQIFGEGAAASALQFDTSRNTLVGTGAVATNATAPFLQLNSCAGTPTGAPSPAAGQIPLVYDSTNNKLYAFNTTWKDLTGGSGSGALTGSGANTQVAYWTGTNALAGSANFIFDVSNVRLGLRVTPSFEFHGQAADGSSFNNTLDCYGTGVTANYRGRAARGTAASFSALQADDNILAISALPGINTNTFASGARANIIMKAGENLTTSNNGTYITFGTTPTGGSTTLAERFRIGPAGQWGIGGATFGTAGNYFRSGGASAAPTWSTLVLPNTATVNRIPYASATDTWTDSANLTYDGTDFGIGSGTRARMLSQNRFRFLNTMAGALQSSAQTGLAVNAYTTITLTTEDFDTDTLHDNSTNTSRVLARIAGKYLCLASVAFDMTSVTTPTQAGTRIIKNGGTSTTYGNQTTAPGTIPAGASATLIGSEILSLAANDYIEGQGIVVGASGTWDTVPARCWTQLVYLGE